MMKYKLDFISFFRKSKDTVLSDFPFFCLLVIICTVPLPNVINNIVVGIFVFYTILQIRRIKFIFTIEMLLPIVFFLWMAISCFWSTDFIGSLHALPKESSLLLLPFSCAIFFVYKKELLIKYYSISMSFYVVFFLIRAFFRFFTEDNTAVFFGHELVTKDLNAIHFSAFVSVAFFYFITKEIKTKIDYFQLLLLALFLSLLNSKSIILVDILLVGLYFFFYSKSANKMRLRNIVLLGIVFFSFLFFNRIKEKIEFEFQLNKDNNIGHTVIPKEIVGDRIISMKEAWENDKFEQSDFFSGASFRVYQFRMFLEIMNEENVFFQGLGLNASYKMLEEKGLKYNVFQGNETTEGYQKKNFHNQYIQVFSELGFIGFVFLILILFVNLKNALKNKDFTHIVFAILMISLFLTESFLWRQRGVVFFTVFYCLFNTIHLSEKEKKIK
jgi:O-antigen ligase